MPAAHPFPEFEKRLGRGAQYRALQLRHQQYVGLLPKEIMELWERDGFCSYGGGLIWTVDPAEFESVLGEWIDTSSKPLVFARTCWGDLYFWEQGSIKLLHIWTGRVITFGSEVSTLFDLSLASESYLERGLALSVFQKVLARLGPPEWDECYGFVPAMQLGGKIRAESAHKMKLQEHLSLLSQL